MKHISIITTCNWIYMLRCGIIAPVSSTSSQELDSARSRSGLFFALFTVQFAAHACLSFRHGVAFVHAKLGLLQTKVALMIELFRHTLESTPILALFLVIGAGYALGRVSVFGFSLGMGGVLFAGLALGAFAPAAVPPPMVGSIGLLLFLYGIGVQYGVQFFAGLRGAGQKHNLIAFAAVMGGLAVSVWGGQWIDISLRMASGPSARSDLSLIHI